MHYISVFAFNLGPIIYVVQTIGAILLKIAPAAIICSFAVSAGLWIFAGPSEKMVKMARSQFVATMVATAIIAGYFIIKTIAVFLISNSFGAS